MSVRTQTPPVWMADVPVNKGTLSRRPAVVSGLLILLLYIVKEASYGKWDVNTAFVHCQGSKLW